MKRFSGAVRRCLPVLAGLLLACLPVSAGLASYGRTCGENLTWKMNDGVLVISGTGKMDSFIEDRPDWDRFHVTGVIIEPGVTGIGALAFENCHKLAAAEIPDTVTSLGDYAFSGCARLKSVTLPDSLRTVGANPFVGCTSLREIILSPDHPYLSVENGLLISREDRRVICRVPGDESAACVIPEGIRSIGSDAFSGCGAMETVLIPDGVTEVGSRAFDRCTGLMLVRLPAAVAEIGSYAFTGCTGLRSVVLREGLRSIGTGAFSYCWILDDLSLPDSLRILGRHPFYDCRNLSRIEISPDHPFFSFENGLLVSKRDAKLVYYAADDESDTCVVPDGVRIIGEKAFQQGRNLRKLVLPGSVERIEKEAFEDCYRVEEFVLAEGLAAVGPGAFAGMAGLKDAVLPEGLESIAEGAFSGCTGLESVLIPASVTEIGSGIFTGTDTVNLTVYTEAGSPAEAYCLENGLRTVRPGETPPPPEAELPAAFTEAYPGYRGLYRLETGTEDEEVFLAQTPEDWLVLLCGARRETGWTVVESAPLPAESRVVMTEGTEMLDLGFARVSVCRYYGDVWGILSIGPRNIIAGPKWIDSLYPYFPYFGIHPWGDLRTIDWITVTESWTEARDALDVSSRAAPDRPDREARTPLYAEPDPDSETVAELLNGAPLFTEEKNGEWTRVSLGRGDGTAWTLEGWIRTEDLVFGEAADSSRAADMCSMYYAREGSTVPLTTPQGQAELPAGDYNSGLYLVIGEKQDGGQAYWLVYNCWTDEPAFVPKELLYRPVG